MALNIVLLIVGMILLVKGADWFVGGSSTIAKKLKIPPLIIGLTLVSMGTSAPEASVSINSAVNGMTDMSIGNVVGSNIFNTLFILGISSIILPLSIGKDMKKYDIPIMVGLYGILLLFAFVITPLKLDIFESVAFLLLFAGYTAFLIIRTKIENKNKQDTQETDEITNKNEKIKKEKPLWLCIILAVVGLAGVIFGGDMVVDNAASIAKTLGMSEVLVGLTIVAVGTSLPELVTSVVASIKKENDIAIGNVIGSNIFNIIKTFLAIFKNPLLLVLIGALITAIVQSSSVMTSMAITMVVTGLITLNQGIYITMGSNIGTCVTALIAGLTSTRNAKRTALIHLIFNVSGVIVFMLIGLFMGFGGIDYGWLFGKMFPNAPQLQMSMFHTIFNVITVIIVLPLTNLLVKLVTKIIPDKKNEKNGELRLKYVEEHLLATPPIAVMQVKNEILNMAEIALTNFDIAIKIICDLEYSDEDTFKKNEKQLDFTNATFFKIKAR